MTFRPDVIVLHDPDDPRWFRIKGADHFGKVIEGARALLHKHKAEFLGETHGGHWLLPSAAWPRLEADLIEEGYTYVRRPLNPGKGRRVGPLECSNPNCCTPYKPSALTDRPCAVCGEPLQLVSPHECGEACKEHQQSASKGTT